MDEESSFEANDCHSRRKWQANTQSAEADKRTIHNPDVPAHRLQNIQRRIGEVGQCAFVPLETLGYQTALLPFLCFRSMLVSRSEEHTSELQSLMRISYAVFCLKKKT